MNAAWYASVILQAVLFVRLLLLRSGFRWFVIALGVSLGQSAALLALSGSGYFDVWLSTEWLRVLLLSVAAVEAFAALTRHHVRVGRLGGWVFVAGCGIAVVVCAASIVWERVPVDRWSARIDSVMPSLVGLFRVADVAGAMVLLVALLAYSRFAWQNSAVRSHAALLCSYLLLNAAGYMAAVVKMGQNLRAVNTVLLISSSVLFVLWTVMARSGAELPADALSDSEYTDLRMRKSELIEKLRSAQK